MSLVNCCTPLALYINWRLAILLFILCGVFTALTTLVVHSDLRHASGRGRTATSPREASALQRRAGAKPLRIDAEVRGLRFVAMSCWRCKCRCCRGGRAVASSRASTAIAVLAIFCRHRPARTGPHTVGEIVMFMSFATMLIKLEQVVSFINSVFMDAAAAGSLTCWLPCRRCDRPDAIDTGRLSGLIQIQRRLVSYDGRRPAVEPVLHRAAGRTIADRSDRRRQVDGDRLLHAIRSAIGLHQDRRHGRRGLTLAACRNIGVVFQALLFNRSIADNLRRQSGRPMKSCVFGGAPRHWNSSSAASAG
jgi:ATP-binding cassette subfamily B protein